MTFPALARLLASLSALVAFAAMAATAHAAPLPGAHISAVPADMAKPASYPGMQTLTYKYGPIEIVPGQNTIEAEPNKLKPDVPGFITRFKPDLIYAEDGSVPPVDIVHLHHGVWLSNVYPIFAAGEEKTIYNFPAGYGLPYKPNDSWIMNYMLHNLTPAPTKVFITYEIDFVPESAAAAKDITPVEPLWLDVAGLRAYPVFDVHKGSGKNGKYTFPDQVTRRAERGKIGPSQQFVAPRDMTLIATAGHLHPGGLWNEMKVTRNGVTKVVFRSEAKYFEPAGAVSWDVAMTTTGSDWKIALKAGDKITIHSTYDSKRASWFESMGIMDTFYAVGHVPGALDPFTQDVPTTGKITHGHLAENDNHGGQRTSLPDVRKMLSGTPTTKVAIRNYIYGRGDFQLFGTKRGRPPVVRRGRSITFTNFDATKAMKPRQSAYHTVTACKAPCTGTTGIAYPLADAKIPFDSGELGYSPNLLGMKFGPAENRHTWKTPKTLPTGTYTYFCRVHPFMRGAFRVAK